VDDLCDNPNAISIGGSEGEARDAITRLEPRGLLAFHRAGAPYRSASFGQVDFNQGKSRRVCYLDSWVVLLDYTAINALTVTFAFNIMSASP
jgi:hypothetical protein